MRTDIVCLFRCPECEGPIAIERQNSIFELTGRTHVVDGVLACGNRHCFPIIDEIPRLVRGNLMTEFERDALAHFQSTRSCERILPTNYSDGDIEQQIRLNIRELYGWNRGIDDATRRRAEKEIEYAIAEYRGRNKKKYVRLIKPCVARAPRSIVDIGGDLGATARCFAEFYEPDVTLAVDIITDNHRAFKTADRRVGLVRADACNLPFMANSIDLVLSAFLLEHVAQWRRALGEMIRIGNECFVSCGPNRWFPFEIGHIDAPFAGTLPKWLAKYTTFLWLWAVGNRRSLQRIQEILAGMSYISSRALKRECSASGRRVRNLFPDLVSEVAKDPDAPLTPLRGLVRRWSGFMRLLSHGLVAAGMEPQMYYYVSRSSGKV